MPAIDKHAPGAFCWAELGTSDAAAARKFYGALFGWSGEDMPSGPGMIYTLLRLQGRDVGGLYALTAEQTGQGIPPHWMVYVATESVEQTIAKAKANGGLALMGPLDVMDVGRMAVLRDPQQAVFSVWQPRRHAGFGIAGENGTFCWAELHTPDPAAARAFYPAVFGWTPKVSDLGPMQYTEWINQGTPVGGAMQLDPQMQAPPNWLIYFRVDDCDATVRRAQELGGGTLVPPMDIPNVGRFAVLRDPQGAVFAVIKLTPHH